MLDALGAAVGQYAMGNISAHSANAATKKSEKRNAVIANWLAEQQYQREVDAYKHRYQWTRDDLKAAGYNQALAFMNGGSAPAPSGGGSSNYAPSSAAGVNMGNITDYLSNSRENTTADYQNKMTEASTAKVVQETANLAEENPYISEREKRNLARNGAETAKALQEAERLKAEEAQIKQQTQFDYNLQPYRESQEFGKAAQELYKGRLSDVSADFLNKYGISKEDAFRLGEDGLKIVGALVASGLGKKAITQIIKKIATSKNSAKSLDFKDLADILKD